jgi:hypothetical protein
VGTGCAEGAVFDGRRVDVGNINKALSHAGLNLVVCRWFVPFARIIMNLILVAIIFQNTISPFYIHNGIYFLAELCDKLSVKTHRFKFLTLEFL